MKKALPPGRTEFAGVIDSKQFKECKSGRIFIAAQTSHIRRLFLVVQSLLRLPGSDRCDDGGQLQADAGDSWMLGGGLSQKLKTYMQKHAPYLQKLFQV